MATRFNVLFSSIPQKQLSELKLRLLKDFELEWIYEDNVLRVLSIKSMDKVFFEPYLNGYEDFILAVGVEEIEKIETLDKDLGFVTGDKYFG